MKSLVQVAVALTLCLLLAGCIVPNQADADEPPQTSPTPEPPTQATSTPTAQPGPEPEPEYGSSCNNQPPTNTMQFDVASEVSVEAIDLIRCGLANAEGFLDRELEGGVSDEFLAKVTVKVVATGEGDPDVGGACCTAISTKADSNKHTMRPFFDVAHTHWLNPWEGWPADPQRETSVVHEYVHGWQNYLGCIGHNSHALGRWLDEGIATQIGFEAMIDKGSFEKDGVLAFMDSATKSGNGEQWNTPLRELEAPIDGIWPGHIGYLALEFAMNLESAPHGLVSLRIICEEAAEGATLKEAFQTTFGMDMDSFYAQFEAWKDQQP